MSLQIVRAGAALIFCTVLCMSMAQAHKDIPDAKPIPAAKTAPAAKDPAPAKDVREAKQIRPPFHITSVEDIPKAHANRAAQSIPKAKATKRNDKYKPKMQAPVKRNKRTHDPNAPRIPESPGQ